MFSVLVMFVELIVGWLFGWGSRDFFCLTLGFGFEWSCGFCNSLICCLGRFCCACVLCGLLLWILCWGCLGFAGSWWIWVFSLLFRLCYKVWVRGFSYLCTCFVFELGFGLVC